MKKYLLALLLSLVSFVSANAITVNSCSFTNPGADRIFFWDQSASKCEILTPGTGLSITGTTINAASASPGGASGSVQYNNAGSFGGFGNWDGQSLTVNIGDTNDYRYLSLNDPTGGGSESGSIRLAVGPGTGTAIEASAYGSGQVIGFGPYGVVDGGAIPYGYIYSGGFVLGFQADYINFDDGPNIGSAGFGFRNSGGTVQYKNDGGSWNPIGSFTLPSLTTGSVLFSNGTTIAQDNSNFFWDDTNNRLGVRVNSSLTEAVNITGNTRLEGDIYFHNNDVADRYITTPSGEITPDYLNGVNLNIVAGDGAADVVDAGDGTFLGLNSEGGDILLEAGNSPNLSTSTDGGFSVEGGSVFLTAGNSGHALAAETSTFNGNAASNGGGVTITGGTGGNAGNSTAGNGSGPGGDVYISAGPAGSVINGLSSDAANNGGQFVIVSGQGGGITNTVGGFGGDGGQFLMTSAAGGSVSTSGGTGGDGGQFLATTGGGGAATASGVANTSGHGGDLTFRTGFGGVSGNSSISNTGGRGGDLSFESGGGGEASVGSGTRAPGRAGLLQFKGGVGGAGGTGGTGGAGSSLYFIPGAGGTGTTPGAVGNLFLGSDSSSNVRGNTILGSATVTGGKLQVRSTTEQQRWEYDGSNRATITVGSTGGTTLDAVGSGATFTFSDDVNVPDEAYASGWNGSTEAPTKNAIYDKIEVVSASAVPPGAVFPYAGGSVPTGYLLCDGSSISTGTYAALYAAIGATYGSAGAGFFNLPDMTGKIPVARNVGDVDLDDLGDTGGEKEHTLTEAEMPAHTHTTGSGMEVLNTPGTGTYATLTDAAGGTGTTGGSTAHNNLQPYIVLNYIIKY